MKDLLNKIEKDKSYLLVSNIKGNNKYLISKINDYFPSLINISYISLSDLISKLYFNISDEILITIMNEFNLNYTTSKMYLSNILLTSYFENQECKNEIFNFNKKNILEIKKYLIKNKLLKSDSYFMNYISNKEIIVYGDELDEFEKSLLINIKYNFISTNVLKNKKTNVIYQFDCIDKEIANMFDSICSLIEKDNNAFKHIYIVSTSDDYIFQLERISNMYNIKLNMKSNISLFDITYAKNILNKIIYCEDINVDEMNNEEYLIYKQVISLINKYSNIKSNPKFYEFIINMLKSTYKNKSIYENGINVIDIDDCYLLSNLNENQYFYIIGMYQGNIPSIYKDEDYYSDLIKSQYKVKTSSDLNTLNLNKLEIIINTNNIFNLSYSLKSNFNNYIISSIINKNNIIEKEIKYSYSKYSDTYNIELYKKKYDSYIKYNTSDLDFLALNKTYKNMNDYKKYSNSFKGISNDKITNFILNNKDKCLTLSYTSLDLYNKCQFAYYINYILKLKSFEGNFMTFVGSLYHKVIEDFFKEEGFDFEKSYTSSFDDEYKKYKLNISEQYLVINLKKELICILDFLKYQLAFIQYKNAMYEQEINIYNEINKNNQKIETKFNGKIDKLLYKEVSFPDGSLHTLVAIIDYKTSEHIKFKINLTQYGLSLQLPIYAYLASNIKGFNNIIVGGFFIQPILSNTIPSCNSIEEYNEIKRKNLLLDGYVNGETNSSELCFDSSYNNSEIIKSLRTKADGQFYKSSKVMSNNEINSQIENVHRIINQSFENILNGEFSINPKIVNGNNVSCNFCEYRDLCYYNTHNYIYLTKLDNDNEIEDTSGDEDE